VIENFKKGIYSAIVTSKVFDEGIDVPDAEVGIIMSGTGSKREFVQRLGRILRPKSNNQKARLIEIVSGRTTETIRSKKRKQNLEV
jgi:superfamily II DNA or RNA helicase